MENKNISQAVIRRLPRYYRYLGELLENNVERISSSELSRKMNITASQIRQDLNHFGGFGQQGYGYNVKYLHTEIGNILGLNVDQHFIIIGAGHLGQALANYPSFKKRGFVLEGLFDISPELIGKSIGSAKVHHIRELPTFISAHHVEIAVLTIPKTVAADIAKTLTDSGIKAIWNFAHTDLGVPDDIIVENVHLSESLMRLSYRINSRRE